MKKNLFSRSCNLYPRFGATSIIFIYSSILLLVSCNSLSKSDNEPIINGYQGGEVKIDSQIWMNQNLNVNVFRNGDPIPQIKTDKEWKKAIEKNNPLGVIMVTTLRTV